MHSKIAWHRPLKVPKRVIYCKLKGLIPDTFLGARSLSN